VVSGADGETRSAEPLADYLRLAHEASDMRLLGAQDPAARPHDWADWQDTLKWFDSRRPMLVAALSAAVEEGFDRVALELSFALERYLESRQLYAEMLDVAAVATAAARRLADRTGEGRALTWQGIALFRQDRFSDSLTASEQAVEIFRATGDRDNEAEALTIASPALGNVGRGEEALASGREAVAIYRETGNRHGVGNALVNLTYILLGQGRLADATTAGEEAVAAFRETADLRRESEALGVLGLAYFKLKQIDQAVAALTDSVRCHADFGDLAGQAFMLRNLAGVLKRDRPADASAAVRAAAGLFRQVGDSRREAESLYELGSVLARAQSSREAREAFDSAAVIFREIGDKEHEAQARAQAKTGRRWRP
jgi:tetratricopeptide (TPR) repeat protein